MISIHHQIYRIYGPDRRNSLIFNHLPQNLLNT